MAIFNSYVSLPEGIMNPSDRLARVPRRIAQGLIGIVDLSDLLFRRLGASKVFAQL
jgi:hypothetical protein